MIGAWAENTPDEATLKALLKPWKGKLGVVLAGHQLKWRAGQAFIIANTPTVEEAAGVNLLGVIGSRDEPNVEGLSGAVIPPKVVAADTETARADFRTHPVTPGGLAFVGNWWQELTSGLHLDGSYFRELQWRLHRQGPFAINAGNTRPALLREALSVNRGPWLVTALPVRPAWGPTNKIWFWLTQLLVGVSIRDWVRLSKRGDVIAVVFWVLLQAGHQRGFGIYKPRGSGFVLTSVGRALWRVLNHNNHYPEVEL